MDIRTLLDRLVSFETHQNELAMQTFLRSIFRDLGFRTEFQEVLPGRSNLIARRGNGGPLFVTHSDTHAPDNHPHPFKMRSDGDLLYGRGVMDAKGQIAALIKALADSNRPCTVALVVDEEGTGSGSETLDLHAEGAVVLEPTELGVAVAQAGFVEVEFNVHGQSAHCSLPETGRNAILLAMSLLDQIKSLNFMRVSHPLFPRPWINLSAMHSGSNANVVPDSCLMQLDTAILPGTDLADAVDELRHLASSTGAEVTIRDLAPAFETEHDNKVTTSLTKAVTHVTNSSAKLVGQRSWTDGENLAHKRIPTIIFGAGNLGLAHSDREAVSLTELQTMAEVLSHFIDTWSEPIPYAPTRHCAKA